ncbi:aminodeoxychorismate synthase component I [Myroides injenensis]|uniref:aminodeoxychorismate synthase component I n=1 Tax=Myroides injenensis TaxID=1183151 RepID=UPI00028841C2|nr:aminodeoxychorismate synthase component I [Myroides injenensis]
MKLKDTIIEKMNKLGSKRIPFLFIIDFSENEAYIESLENVNDKEILYNFNGVTNITIETPVFTPIHLKSFPISFENYQKQFDKVHHQITIGNTYLINLTIQTPIEINGNLTDVFLQSKAKYKLKFRDEFVCFSPEIFIKVKDNKIYSYPMKGTIDANLPNAEMLILNDEKETAEHYTIVDLIRNDLNIVAKKVKVNKFKYLDRIETSKGPILQMSSEISGELPSTWHNEIGSIFNKLLPAGSITGSPKESTVNIIKNTETYNRKFYTGVCGIYDGKSIDSAVMIRFIEKTTEGFVYKSGGGITFSSDVNKEYDEIIQKIYIPQ